MGVFLDSGSVAHMSCLCARPSHATSQLVVMATGQPCSCGAVTRERAQLVTVTQRLPALWWEGHQGRMGEPGIRRWGRAFLGLTMGWVTPPFPLLCL